MNFCDRLKNAREDRDISQQEMADLLNITQSNYSKIETGIQEPSLNQLMIIAEYFNLTIDELLGVDPDKYVKAKVAEFVESIDKDSLKILYKLCDK